MTSIADTYRRRAQLFADTIAAVPDDKWDAQSPCDDWKASDVVQHVVDTQGLFLGFVNRTLEPGPAASEDPAAAWDAARAQTQAGLDDPARAAETYQGFMGESTYEQGTDQFLSLDLIVHRWDLARAAGLDDTIPPEDLADLVARMEAMNEKMGEMMRGPGAFGPELTPPDGADEQTRVLAFIGRQAW